MKMAIARARELVQNGRGIFTTPNLRYFLQNDVTMSFSQEHPEWLDCFISLDDNDILVSLKEWIHSDDRVLALLADSFIHRRLFKAKELKSPIHEHELHNLRKSMAEALDISEKEAAYLVRHTEIGQTLYSSIDDHVGIHLKDGNVCDISNFSELLTSNFKDMKSHRYYLFYHPSLNCL